MGQIVVYHSFVEAPRATPVAFLSGVKFEVSLTATTQGPLIFRAAPGFSCREVPANGL